MTKIDGSRISLVYRPQDGSERPILFRQDARAWGKLVCLGFRSSDWFLALRRVWRRHHECVNFLCSHTHTHRLKSLIFLCTHTHTHGVVTFFGQHNPHVLWESSDNIVDNQIICEKSIDLLEICVCVVCYQKFFSVVTVVVLVSIFFETQQTAPARPLFFSAPPQVFFSLFI